MLKTLAVGFALSVGATVALAAPMPSSVAGEDAALVRVAEHCGPGWYAYGPDRSCHRFNTPYGHNRGTVIACPPAMHIGPEGHFCWPN